MEEMTMTKADSYVYIDWLGNTVHVGDWALYSSKSQNTGMNLGKVEYIGPSKKTGAGQCIQVRIHQQSSAGWSKGRLVTLDYRDGAYKSVTRYSGTIPQIED